MKRRRRFYHHRFDIFFNIKSKYHVKICNIGKHKLKFHIALCGKELEFAVYPSKPHEIFLDHNVLLDNAYRIVRIKIKKTFLTHKIFQNKATPPPPPITSASYGKKVQVGVCPVQDSVWEHFALTMVTGPIPSCHGRNFAQCFWDTTAQHQVGGELM